MLSSNKNKGILLIGVLAVILLIIMYRMNSIDTSQHSQNNNNSLPSKTKTTEMTDTQSSSNVEHNLKHKIDTLFVQHQLLENSSTAPSYINDQTIVFDVDQYIDEKGTSVHNILKFDRVKNKIENIYQSKPNISIGSLVGINNVLYWVEYPVYLEAVTPWEIKYYSLITNERGTLRKGVGEDFINPPVLFVENNQLSWIEKKIHEKVVTSEAIIHIPDSNKNVVVGVSHLNEKDKKKKDGRFMLHHRPVEEGLLINQSVFKRVNNKTVKSFDLYFYPYNNKTAPTVIYPNSDEIIDFTANQEWLVLCTYGKVQVINRKSGQLQYEVLGESKELTFDTPFIRGEFLYYRYSTSQIFKLNLDNGDKEEVTSPRSTTSKIFNSNQFLGFAYNQSVNPNSDNRVEFTVINTEAVD
ncbi:hypothetical protein [Paenibacillus agilis]|uniref:DUF5050 domain-containing protein n=1 Tax=Paenibacillus agilis TaxID=3020863 RepID=A0A559IKB1_9BACL|nr:hypothetical protein [Paenibacillus agilis]TVX88094.1 hypothetical protein FPZ44_19485 [Paenibacillus agilis]